MKREIINSGFMFTLATCQKVILAIFAMLIVGGCASTSQKDSEFLGNVKYIEGSSEDSALEAEAAAAQREAELAKAEADRLREEMAERDRQAEAARAEAEAAAAQGTDPRVTDSNIPEGSEAAAIPSELSIYFGYDEYEVEAKYNDLLSKHASYMMDNPEVSVRLEGNCDERGGREYNLALGSRRSESVKRALVGLGVNESRIESISFGKEKPIAFGNDEDSYKLNRRADFVYR